MVNIQFLIIDPQNDFAHPDGQLFVTGADKDVARLAVMLQRHLDKIDQIHVTLDSHHWVHIAHPIFWQNSQGQHPDPFTIITLEAVLSNQWRTTDVHSQQRALNYLMALKNNQRYNLTIWPPHCLIGQPGHNVVAPLISVLNQWENNYAVVNYILKGSNCWTEHYSAIKADVPDVADPKTQLNVDLIATLQQADLIAISGQALSHCVANTVRDIADNIGEENIHKLILIEDTTSSVPGFEALGEQFLIEMQDRGMKTAKSTDLLA